MIVAAENVVPDQHFQAPVAQIIHAAFDMHQITLKFGVVGQFHFIGADVEIFGVGVNFQNFISHLAPQFKGLFQRQIPLIGAARIAVRSIFFVRQQVVQMPGTLHQRYHRKTGSLKLSKFRFGISAGVNDFRTAFKGEFVLKFHQYIVITETLQIVHEFVGEICLRAKTFQVDVHRAARSLKHFLLLIRQTGRIRG